MRLRYSRDKKAIITVPIKRNELFRQKVNGIIDGAIEIDYLKRRVSENSVLYARHFDMGWLANGDDLSFAVNVPITEIKQVSPITNYDYWPTRITLEQTNPYDALLTALLDLGKENWSSLFMEITDSNKSEYYSSSGEGTSGSYEAGKGYQIADPTVLANSTPRSFASLAQTQGFTANNVSYKITSTPNYADPDAVFNLTGDIKIFTFPKLMLWHGQNHYSEQLNWQNNPGFQRVYQLLGLILAPAPRNFTHFNSAYDTYTADYDAWNASIGGNRWMLPHYWNTTSHQMWIDLFVNHPAMRLRTLNLPNPYNDSFTNVEGDLVSGSPGDFVSGFDATRPHFITVDSEPDPWSYPPWISWRPWHQFEGQCLGLIQQGSNWFYVWRKTDSLVADYVASGTIFFNSPIPAKLRYGGVHWHIGTDF